MSSELAELYGSVPNILSPIDVAYIYCVNISRKIGWICTRFYRKFLSDLSRSGFM